MKKVIICILLFGSFSLVNAQTKPKTETEKEKLEREIRELESKLKDIEDCVSSQEERERIAALNPFDIDYMKSRKYYLYSEYDKISSQCTVSDCPHDVVKKLNEVLSELDILDKQLKGKEEWLQSIGNISKEELENREKQYQTFADMARMSDYCYKDGKNRPTYPEGWEDIKNINEADKELVSIINAANDNKYGFKCSLLKNDEGKYVLAFGGTDFGMSPELPNDVIAGWSCTENRNCPQTQKALETVKKLLNSRKIKLDELQVTGHSLGGGLASEVAVEYGLTAYTFNSMGVSGETKQRVEREENHHGRKLNIINIRSSNDFLTTNQNRISGNPYINNDVIRDTKHSIGGALRGFGEGGTHSAVEGAKNDGSADGGLINSSTVGGIITIKEDIGGHPIDVLRLSIEQRLKDIRNVMTIL
jgi:hypothetical protein